MMTSFAFILGLLPLVIATGASELARRAVGTPVFGRMIVASLIGIFAVPPLYVSFPIDARAAAARRAPARGRAPGTRARAGTAAGPANPDACAGGMTGAN